MLLVIDEIYTAKRLEFFNGVMHGITESGDTASTILCFMIQPLNCNFKEVIGLISLRGLSVELLQSHFVTVMAKLKDYVFVQAILMNNLSTNR